jgi:hypothetical protein
MMWVGGDDGMMLVVVVMVEMTMIEGTGARGRFVGHLSRGWDAGAMGRVPLWYLILGAD